MAIKRNDKSICRAPLLCCLPATLSLHQRPMMSEDDQQYHDKWIVQMSVVSACAMALSPLVGNSTASIDIVASDGNNCSSVFYPMKTQPPSRTLFLTTPFVVRTEMKTSSSEPLLILQAAATTHTLLNESRANYSNRASL